MKTRQLGNSELNVSILGLGCWPLGGGPGWGDGGEAEAIATVHAALDWGINLLDTAEVYNDGRSEEIVGKALLGHRDRALVATKVAAENCAPAALREHCEGSLRRLMTDHIDLYQVHWPIIDHSIEDAFATLVDLRAEGKVREIGVSNHGVEQMHAALSTGAPVCSNQLCYSLGSRGIEFEIAPLCREQGLGIIAYMALMQGVLAGAYEALDDIPEFRARTRHFNGDRPGSRHGEEGAEVELASALASVRAMAADLGVSMAHLSLAWVAAKPGVSCVLLGSRKRSQLERNMAAVSLALESETMAALDEATLPLKTKLGPNVDYFQGWADRRTR